MRAHRPPIHAASSSGKKLLVITDESEHAFVGISRAARLWLSGAWEVRTS
jgi:hypothetical protein